MMVDPASRIATNPTREALARACAPWTLVLLLSLLTGCASRSTGTDRPAASRDEPAEADPDARPSRDVISEDEIDTVEFQSAYEVVEALRPRWLMNRGITSFIDPRPDFPEVFLDGTSVGELDYLWTVSAIHVKELRYWGPERAGVRFGMGYPRGVIEIISKGIP